MRGVPETGGMGPIKFGSQCGKCDFGLLMFQTTLHAGIYRLKKRNPGQNKKNSRRWTFTVHGSNWAIIGLILLDPAVLICHSQFLHHARKGSDQLPTILQFRHGSFLKPSLFHPFSSFFPVFPIVFPSFSHDFLQLRVLQRPVPGPLKVPFWAPHVRPDWLGMKGLQAPGPGAPPSGPVNHVGVWRSHH